MAQSIVAQAIAIPRMGQMLKIKDLYEESNLKNNVDLIAVIAKIGDMKMATQTSRGSVPAREIYLCDDSWAMIKLIARDYFAETSASFKSDQIIYIRNVKPMKLRGYTVLATMPDTLLNHEVNTPEALSLRCWLSQNNLEFKQDGLKDLLFKRFTNLSTSNDRNSSPAPQENKELQSSQSSQSSNLMAASQTNDADDIKNNFIVNVLTDKKRKFNGDVSDINVKVIKIDLTPNTAMRNSVELDNTMLSDTPTQKVYSETSEKMTVSKDNETVISIDSNDEIMDKKEKKETFKKEVFESEDDDLEAVDGNDSIISEIYSALMSAQSQWKCWNIEKDKYIIHFLSNCSIESLTDDIYLKLLEANLKVFHGFTVDDLKSRVENLGSAKNYVYLLQLCGGKKIKSEKEKVVFVKRVEKLRRLMRSKEIKEEYSF